MNIFLKLSTLLLLSSVTLANATLCMTHAQCQGYKIQSTGCFIIQIEEGKCEEQCFPIETSSYCKIEDGKNFGSCQDESLSYKSTKIDPKSECKNAITRDQLSEII